MIETRNEMYGFWGAMNLEGKAAAAWPLAMRAIAKSTGMEPDVVRAFLHSAWGRHFADTVYDRLCSGRNLTTAVDEAVERWQGWTLGRRTRRELGIPTPMRYLDGMVYAAAAYAEAI